MNRLTPLILMILVVGLGYVALQQSKKEAQEAEDTAITRLFEGVDMSKLQGIRIENIERGQHVRVERDGSGRWYLTDPLAWPAASGVITKLTQILTTNGADPVPEELIADAEASFEPPRGFIETEEALGNGEVRRVRVEVGAVDIDGIRIFVKRDGEMLRTVRNIDNIFDFNVHEYRSKKVFSFQRGAVAEVERVGGWYENDEPIPLGMKARNSGANWQLLEPMRCTGDPLVFGAWTTYLSTINAQKIVNDLPDVDMRRFGLDQPWLTVRLKGFSGNEQALHLVEKDGHVYGRRNEETTIFQFELDAVSYFGEDIGNFYELQFARLERKDIEHVWIEQPSQTMRFSRGPKGEGWTVAVRPQGGSEFGAEMRADDREMADLFQATETAEAKRMFTDVGPDEFFAEGVAETSLYLEPYSGQRQGGRFAPSRTFPDGSELAPYQRFGDEAAQAMAPEFAALTNRSLESFLNTRLWEQTNTWLRTLVIEGEGVTRSFERGDGFDWRDQKSQEPARELDPVLDHLLFLKAKEHLPLGEAREPLAKVLTVTFTDSERRTSTAQLGVTADGVAHVRMGDLEAILDRGVLHGDLLSILGVQ